jgi:hypothetical protein
MNVNRRFGGTCRLSLQGRRGNQSRKQQKPGGSLCPIPHDLTWVYSQARACGVDKVALG